MDHRKAQITVFIILGLAVLLAASLFFFVRHRLALFSPDELLPPEIVPVKTYIDRCLETVSREAIVLAGLQGGYADVPDRVKRRISYLQFDRRLDFGVPYWYYYGGNQYPSLSEVKENLEARITREVQACADLSVFEDQFDIVVTGTIRTEVLLGDSDVTVRLTYPLQIDNKLSTQRTKMKNFVYVAPLRLKHLYTLALRILEAENKETFLENMTFDLMVLQPKIPIEDVQFTCTRRIDMIANIRSIFKELMSYNLADVRIRNTRHSQFLEGDKEFAKNHFAWDIGLSPGEYPDVTVDFTYDTDWPLHMHITPNEGARLRAEPMRLFGTLPLCYLHYHYTYNIDYPVLVSISDFDTPKHEAYEFQFVTPVLLNNNRADRSNVPGFFEMEIIPTYDTAFCDEFQKKRITITASNRATNERINYVNVSAQCLQYLCPVGRVEPWRGTYELVADVPDCGAVTLIGTREGYSEGRTEIDTDIESTADIALLPVKSFPYRIVKHKLSNPAVPYELAGDELVMITVKNRRYNFTSESIYPLELDVPVELIVQWDQHYDLEIFLIKGESIVGGYNSTWVVPRVWAEDSDTIVFHIFEDEDAHDDENAQFNLLLNISRYSQRVPRPEFETA